MVIEIHLETAIGETRVETRHAYSASLPDDHGRGLEIWWAKHPSQDARQHYEGIPLEAGLRDYGGIL
jgi:hypothetical protein